MRQIDGGGAYDINQCMNQERIGGGGSVYGGDLGSYGGGGGVYGGGLGGYGGGGGRYGGGGGYGRN